MILASDLREGAVLKLEKDIYRVESARLHKGGGQAGAMVHLTLKNLQTGSVTERRFRPSEKLEDLALERRRVEYLYREADLFHFMDVESYDQLSLPEKLIGPAARFLQPNLRLDVELLDERPVSVVLPEAVEIRIASTGPPVRDSESSTYKPATLENGMEILVPQFIKTGDIVRVDVSTGKYLERVKG